MMPANGVTADEWSMVEGCFLRQPSLDIHVLGDFQNFLIGLVPKIFNGHGVRYHEASADSPVGAKHAFMVWSPRSHVEVPTGLVERVVRSGNRVINMTRFVPDKKFNDDVFQQVAGYPLHVDPRKHTGLGIQKERFSNGLKRIEIIEFPIETPDHEHYVYQRLLDNTVAADDGRVFAYDYRVAITARRITIVSGKVYAHGKRFSTAPRGFLYAPHRAFFPKEIALIHRYCDYAGFEWGQLDIVRDRTDGRIYIVDANNSPYSIDSDPVEGRCYREILATAALPFFWPAHILRD